MSAPDDKRLLNDCLALLHRFALERTGWRGIFQRWYYPDEPLRHDAANVIRRAGYSEMIPDGTAILGATETQR